MDVTHLEFPDGSFDAAVASFLFCVLPDEVQMQALREIERVLKPVVPFASSSMSDPKVPTGRLLRASGKAGWLGRMERGTIGARKSTCLKRALKLSSRASLFPTC